MNTYLKIYIGILLILFIFTACENPLDKGPLGVISGDVVWIDETLIEAYFADLYDNSNLIETPESTNPNGAMFASTIYSDEGLNRARNGAYSGVTGMLSSDNTNAPGLNYWNNGAWQYLRRINVAIFELSDESSPLDVIYREERLGQAYFLRALFYFEMVKRYGGVPIVEQPQDATLNFDELVVPRSTEKDTYDFIKSNLNQAIELLSDKVVDNSRISVWAAHALRSRVMLYAGSISEFNDKLVLTDADGLIGINSSEAKSYYSASMESSRALLPTPLGTGPFHLRPGNTTEKYRSIFNDIGSSNDSESIMIMQFTGVNGRPNYYGELLLPRTTPSTHRGWGNGIVAYYETIEWFEYKDGTPGTELPSGYPNNGSDLLIDNINDSTFHDLDKLFENKDPRFRASMVVAQLDLPGLGTAYMHGSVVDPEAATSAGLPLKGEGQNVNQPSTLSTYKLANDEEPQVQRETYTHPLTVYRLAEIYLNFAEAAFATGNTTEALTALNIIRERVGLLPKENITFEDIVQERRVELIFEYHRFWDLKRWRMAKEPLSKEYNGLHYIWDTENDTYAMFLDRGDNRDRNFEDRHYYLPVSVSTIEANDWNQTPGYE